MPMSTESIKRMVAERSASSEEDLEGLFELMRNPVPDKQEMGEIFKRAIDYNPIEYYDRTYIEKFIVKILNDKDTPSDIKSMISEKESLIVESALAHFDNIDPKVIENVVIKTIKSITGWHATKFFNPLDEEFRSEFDSDSDEPVEFEVEDTEELDDEEDIDEDIDDEDF